MLQEYLAADLLACAPRAERLGHSILLAPIEHGSDARRSGILRCWLDSLGTLPPSQAVLAQMHALIHSRADSEACVSWGRWHLRRYNGRLYLLPQVPALSPNWQAQWHTQVPLHLANGSCVSAAPSAEGWPQARTLCACARAVSAATPPSASIPKPSKTPPSRRA